MPKLQSLDSALEAGKNELGDDPEDQTSPDTQPDDGGQAPPATPPAEGDDKTQQPADLSKVVEGINELGEGLKAINTRIDSLEEKSQPPPPAEDKVDEDEEIPIEPPEDWRVARKEQRETAEEISRKVTQEELDKREKEKQDAEAAVIKEQETIDRVLDEGYKESVEKGLMPKVEKQDDPNDPGKVARREVFGFGASLGSTNIPELAKILKKVHGAGLRYDFKAKDFLKTSKPNPGKTTPVSSSSGKTADGGLKPTPKLIHGTTIDRMIERAELNE